MRRKLFRLHKNQGMNEGGVEETPNQKSKELTAEFAINQLCAFGRKEKAMREHLYSPCYEPLCAKNFLQIFFYLILLLKKDFYPSFKSKETQTHGGFFLIQIISNMKI